MEYTNGIKATWRYWVWKRMRERITVHPRFATILFLAGPTPEDLVCATKNGFRIENIVAIDIDKEAVSRARKLGCTSIQGNIHDIVSLWKDGDIHGVIADYCCGLTYEQFQQSETMMSIIGGPVVLNFQRGRESSELTSVMRKIIERFGVSKNRAEQFVFIYKIEYVVRTIAKRDGLDSMLNDMSEVEKLSLALHITRSEFLEYSEVKDELLKPQFYSYKSNKVVMDTVVITNQVKLKGLADLKISYAMEMKKLIEKQDKIVKRLKEIGETPEFKVISKSERSEIDSILSTTRKLSACKAVRTMNFAAKQQSKSN